MVELIIGAVVIAGIIYVSYKVLKGASVDVNTLDLNNDGKLNKADAEVVFEKVTEKIDVAKVAKTTKAKQSGVKSASKAGKKAGRPKKTG